MPLSFLLRVLPTWKRPEERKKKWKRGKRNFSQGRTSPFPFISSPFPFFSVVFHSMINPSSSLLWPQPRRRMLSTVSDFSIDPPLPLPPPPPQSSRTDRNTLPLPPPSPVPTPKRPEKRLPPSLPPHSLHMQAGCSSLAFAVGGGPTETLLCSPPLLLPLTFIGVCGGGGGGSVGRWVRVA